MCTRQRNTHTERETQGGRGEEKRELDRKRNIHLQQSLLELAREKASTIYRPFTAHKYIDERISQ